MKVLAFYTFLGLIIAPAWLVESGDRDDSILWTVVVVVLMFFGGALVWGISTIEPRSDTVAGVRRPKPWARALVFVSLLVFAATVLLSSSMTYVRADGSCMATVADAIASLGEHIFPVVGKYGTLMNPPLDMDTLLKVQAVMSSFLLGGFVIAALWMLAICSQSNIEILTIYPSLEDKFYYNHVQFFAYPFILLFVLIPFFGWQEFGPWRSSDAKGCTLSADCYVRGDDQLLVLAATVKTLVLFGFLVCFVVIAREHIAVTMEIRKSRRR